MQDWVISHYSTMPTCRVVVIVLWLRTMHWLLEALSEISLTRSLRREAICPERGLCSLLWCDGFPWFAFSIEALCSVHFILYF